MYFRYEESALLHLKKKDRLLGEAIDAIGPVYREIEPDLFAALTNSIVGQQISTAAQRTIWARMKQAIGPITPARLCSISLEDLQAQGISFRKAGYIQGFAQKVHSGAFDVDALHQKSDAEVIEALSSLNGIGVWTAEMMMIFSMERQNIFSFGDLAIHRGLRMLYHHRRVSPALFEKYRRRYCPYGSVASLYLWAIAGGAIPGMRDYAPKAKTKKADKKK